MIISHKNALALSMYHFPILVPLSIPIKLSHNYCDTEIVCWLCSSQL